MKMTLTFQKVTSRVTSKVKSQIEHIRKRILASGREKHWKIKTSVLPVEEAGDGRSNIFVEMVVECADSRSDYTIANEAEGIVKVAKTAGVSSGWYLVQRDGEEIRTKNSEVGYAEVRVPPKWRAFFSHIYEREAQVDIIMSAVTAGIESGFRNRFHSVLWGAPACGKTEIVRSFKDMLGKETVLEYDCTSTTQAGAIKDLAERDVLPRILVLEEAEKADEGSLRWLLSVLDHRGEIRKTTAVSHIQRDVKMLCIATVNDFELFQTVMSGALASRFSNALHCPKPSVRILTKILEREVAKVCGDVRWIQPALDYASQKGITDPRRVTAICLCGKDKLLSGHYQRTLDKCEG